MLSFRSCTVHHSGWLRVKVLSLFSENEVGDKDCRSSPAVWMYRESSHAYCSVATAPITGAGKHHRHSLSWWLMVCTFCSVHETLYYSTKIKTKEQKTRYNYKFLVSSKKGIHESHLMFSIHKLFYWLHLTGCFLKQKKTSSSGQFWKYWYMLLVKIQFLYRVHYNKFRC